MVSFYVISDFFLRELDTIPDTVYLVSSNVHQIQQAMVEILITVIGKISLSDCLSCPGGKYCATQGLTNWTGDCSEGFYCTVNSTTDTPLDGITGDECPPGSYCPTGSPAPVPCPDGK